MNYEQVTRDQVATYLDTTPSTSSNTWGLLGVGITDYGINYNPQVNTEKWIINKNASNSLDSYQMQGDISQEIYMGDPCFEFVNELRRSLAVGSAAASNVLDIDMYDSTTASGVTTYTASMTACTIAITKYMADRAVIEYSVYYNGDPVQGTVTIVGGVPTFTPNV